VPARERLRIVHVTPHPWGGPDEINDYAGHLARELGRRGHDVVHVASDADADGAGESERNGYRLVRVPSINALERLDVPYPLVGRGLVRALQSPVAAADVVHAHGFLYLTTLCALWLARRGPHAPVRVVTEHVGHVEYDSKVLDAAESAAIATVGRWALRSADAIVAYNDRVAAELAKLVPERRVQFIGNGVDAERFRPGTQRERAALRAAEGWDDRPRVLYVGRVVAKKGIDLVLDVADRTAGSFEFVVVGPGTSPRASGENVHILGPRSRERVAELYRAADVLLLPSRNEGFPLVAQEAMASGLPVVLCADPSYGAHLDGAGPGALLVECEVDALRAALHAVLDDPASRAEASAAARAHATRAFSWTAVVDDHEALYERLVRERRR
jgi:glycosyltransferase involved in cell wall biosynthesis